MGLVSGGAGRRMVAVNFKPAITTLKTIQQRTIVLSCRIWLPRMTASAALHRDQHSRSASVQSHCVASTSWWSKRRVHTSLNGGRMTDIGSIHFPFLPRRGGRREGCRTVMRLAPRGPICAYNVAANEGYRGETFASRSRVSCDSGDPACWPTGNPRPHLRGEPRNAPLTQSPLRRKAPSRDICIKCGPGQAGLGQNYFQVPELLVDWQSSAAGRAKWCIRVVHSYVQEHPELELCATGWTGGEAPTIGIRGETSEFACSLQSRFTAAVAA
jgi:hypothetical protein